MAGPMRLKRCPACNAPVAEGDTTDGTQLVVDAHEQMAGPNRYVWTGGGFSPIGQKAAKYGYVDHAATCSRA